MNVNSKNISIQGKLEVLGVKIDPDSDDLSEFDEKTINLILAKKNIPKDDTKKPAKKINKEIDKTTDKYKMVLKFVNKILENLGKNQVDDLLDFKNIDKEDIIKDINKQTLVSMEKEIYQVFDKRKLGNHNRNKVDHYILSVLRAMAKDIGLKFSPIKKLVQQDRMTTNYNFYNFYLP